MRIDADFNKRAGKWRGFAIAAGVLVLAAGASAPASASNIFEALFGSRPAAVSSQRPAAAPGFRELTITMQRKKKVAQKKKKAAPSKFTVVKPGPALSATPGFRQVIAAARPPVLPGPLGPFLLDRTLYRGDVVVTTVGLRIFAGGHAMRHSPASFLTLSKAGGYLDGRQRLLAAIEQNNRRGGAEISYRQYQANTSSPGFRVLTPASHPSLLRVVTRPPAGPARVSEVTSR